MKKILVVPPSETPITLDEAKSNIGIYDSSRDMDVKGAIGAAVEFIQGRTGRKLLTQTWRLIMDNVNGPIALPFGQLQRVIGIKYRDPEGVEHTASDAEYYVEGIGTDDGAIYFKDSFSFPALFPHDAISIDFVCGWKSPVGLPDQVKWASFLYVDRLVNDEDTMGTVEGLVGAYQISWWGE